MLGKTIRSFRYAINGLRTVWLEEHNFRTDIYISIVVLAAASFLDFSNTEWLFVIMAIILVLSGEIVNTAVEDIMNKVNPEYDPVVGKIKDTMAAYVLLTSAGSAVVGLIVFINHFTQ